MTNANISIEDLTSDCQVRAINVTRNTTVTDQVLLALNTWQRLRGLIGHTPLSDTEGMLLRPCNSIHTCFMGYAIDALFLDSRGKVVRLYEGLKPWRLSAIHFDSCCVLELAAGSAVLSGTVAGDVIVFQPMITD